MATTPNYGFIMPDPTDLVTDLPADFKIFGDEVDLRVKALNPETTEGDLAYRGATANEKVRLGIGTAGQVLTVNAGATAPEWDDLPTPAAPATSYALLNSGNTTVPSASTFNVTGLTSFNTYYVFFNNVGHTNSGGEIFLRINGSTASNYNTFGFGLNNVTPSNSNLFRIDQTSTTAITMGAMSGTNGISGSCEIRGGNSSGNKLYNASAAGNGSGNQHSTKAGFWNDATLITSITIATGTGNVFNSGSLFIYGGN